MSFEEGTFFVLVVSVYALGESALSFWSLLSAFLTFEMNRMV